MFHFCISRTPLHWILSLTWICFACFVYARFMFDAHVLRSAEDDRWILRHQICCRMQQPICRILDEMDLQGLRDNAWSLVRQQKSQLIRIAHWSRFMQPLVNVASMQGWNRSQIQRAWPFMRNLLGWSLGSSWIQWCSMSSIIVGCACEWKVR